MTEGGRDTFECDGCGDETPRNDRRIYVRPDQPDDGEVATDDLCLACSARKDSTRLFRPADDQEGR